MKNKIFKSNKFTFIELRYISKVTSCDRKHTHNELTLSAIKEGNININFFDKINYLKPNMLSIINPHVIHCATLSNITTIGCYVLYIDINWCKSLQQALFNDVKDYIPISVTLLKDKTFYDIFILLCNELLSNDISLIEKEEKCINFMTELFLRFCNSCEIIKNDTKNSKLAYEIKNYLKKNVENEIFLEDIASNMNFSVVHILRVFKKEFGIPIHSYLINERVHLAKELLSKNISIAEVAQMSGFFDQSHLNKIFKRVFQLTPKEYQKNIFS